MRRTRPLAALPIVLVAALGDHDARACGAAYPGGPIVCDYPRKSVERAPIARLSASWAYTSTTMLFGEGRRSDLERHAVFGAIEVPLARALVLDVGAGGVAGGDLVHGRARDTIGPGFTGFVGVAGRVLDERGALPFVQLSATLSGTHMITRTDDVTTDGAPQRITTPRWTAFDLRAAAVAGKTIASAVTPYVVLRAFGGPAYWTLDGASVTGTDLHKYQVGGGLSVALLERRLDLFAEGVPLGERGIAAGVGTTFF